MALSFGISWQATSCLLSHRDMLHMVLFLENLEPLQPPPWIFRTAEWNHEQLKQLSRPPQGPLQIGLSCMSQLHAGALVPIDLFSHLSTCRRRIIAWYYRTSHLMVIPWYPSHPCWVRSVTLPTSLLRIHHHGSWTHFQPDPFTPFRAVASVSWHCKMMPLVLRRSLPALGTQAKMWTYIEEARGGHRRLDGCEGQLDAWNSLGMQVSSAKHKWNWVRQNSLKFKHA